jgi:hypothetical protein
VNTTKLKPTKKKIVGGNTSRNSCKSRTPIRRATPEAISIGPARWLSLYRMGLVLICFSWMTTFTRWRTWRRRPPILIPFRSSRTTPFPSLAQGCPAAALQEGLGVELAKEDFDQERDDPGPARLVASAEAGASRSNSSKVLVLLRIHMLGHVALKVQCPTADSTAADERDLHLVDVDAAPRLGGGPDWASAPAERRPHGTISHGAARRFSRFSGRHRMKIGDFLCGEGVPQPTK